jgi:hypothetical protein
LSVEDSVIVNKNTPINRGVLLFIQKNLTKILYGDMIYM